MFATLHRRLAVRLISLAEAAGVLACKDRRTAKRRLAALAVPVVAISGRLLVDHDVLIRAIRAAAHPLDTSWPVSAVGVALAPGERLWDARATSKEARRRVNVPGRGSRERELRAATAAYPASAQGSRDLPNLPLPRRQEDVMSTATINADVARKVES